MLDRFQKMGCSLRGFHESWSLPASLRIDLHATLEHVCSAGKRTTLQVWGDAWHFADSSVCHYPAQQNYTCKRIETLCAYVHHKHGYAMIHSWHLSQIWQGQRSATHCELSCERGAGVLSSAQWVSCKANAEVQAALVLPALRLPAADECRLRLPKGLCLRSKSARPYAARAE